jgi:hypothetical protein
MLTTSLHSTNAIEVKLDALDYPKIVAKALVLVNACFRAISSLKEIIVKVYKDSLSDYIQREIKNYKWTISITEYVEELDFNRSFNNIKDDDYCYNNNNSSSNDYDINNDSDF